jgi:hypothetical protein
VLHKTIVVFVPHQGFADGAPREVHQISVSIGTSTAVIDTGMDGTQNLAPPRGGFKACHDRRLRAPVRTP